MRHLMIPAAGAVLGAMVGVAAGAAAPAAAAKPLSADRVKMIQNIPGDALAFAMIGNCRDLAGKADAFIKDILPPQVARQVNFLKMATEGAGLGETFNADAPLAIVLMDPKDYAPDLLQKKKPATKPAEDDASLTPEEREMRARVRAMGGRGGEDFDNRNLPVLFILSGKDIARMFPSREAKADGPLTRLTWGEQEAWAVEKDGLVFISHYKSIIASMPPKVPAAVAIGSSGEDLLARSDVLGWVNRPRCEGLRGTPFAKLVWRRFDFVRELGFLDSGGEEEGGYRSSNPLATAVHWFEATRAGTFAQSRFMIGGLTLGKEGPRVEIRVPFQEGTPMGKALAAAQDLPAGQLTAGLPDKPFIFAYGCRKDILRTPAEQKKKQAEGLTTNPFLKEVPEEMRKRIGQMIQSIHEQVTEVQHWAGQTKEDGPVAVTSTIRCKDSAALKRTIQDNVPVFEALLNSALGQSGEEKFKLAYYEGNEPAGQVRVDMIQANHPELDKMLQDEDAGARFRSMMLKVFPGETNLRVRLAAVDKTTLVVAVGGGRRFLNDAVSAARDGNSRLELSDDVKSSLAQLPAKRFALFIVNATGGAGFFGTAMMSTMMGGAAQIKFKAAPPVVVSLSADKGDLLIVGHLPALVIKRIVGTVSGAGEEEVEEDDAPATRPATRPVGRGAINLDASTVNITVERKTTVEDVPVKATGD